MTFPTTHWSLIAAAALDDDPEGRKSLDELCRRYRGPVLSYFRSKRLSPEDAEDLTQSLFNHMLQNRALLRADADRGRFRHYLLAVAANAHRNWQKAASSIKRGSGIASISLEQLAESGWEPPAPGDESAGRFDYEWAVSIMSAAWKRIESENTRTPEKAARFAVLRRFLPGSETAHTYEAAAAALGIPVHHVRTLIHRLRDAFRSAIRDQIADTVLSREDIDGEMTYLHHVIARLSGQPEASAFSDFMKQSGAAGP